MMRRLFLLSRFFGQDERKMTERNILIFKRPKIEQTRKKRFLPFP